MYSMKIPLVLQEVGMSINTTPKIYLSAYIRDFSDKEARYHLTRRKIRRGELLTVPGTINNTTHFIHQGMMHLSLTHSSGNVKSLVFYGPNTIFPLGVVPHETPIGYEMELRAFTDMEVTSFSYQTLRQMCVDDGELAAEILEQNCDFISYLFYQDMNRAYTSTPEHVCDILYLFLLNVQPKDNIIPLSQSELASLVGISRSQIERILKALREKQVIITLRGSIQIISIERLHQACSADIRGFNPVPSL